MVGLESSAHQAEERADTTRLQTLCEELGASQELVGTALAASVIIHGTLVASEGIPLRGVSIKVEAP